MKILLTAPPRTGKSTIIHKVVSILQERCNKVCCGVLSTEKLDTSGSKRIGFTAVLSDGYKAEFMTKQCYSSTKELKKEYRVGPYVVNVDVIDEILVPALRRFAAEGSSTDQLLYIDEIGRAQAHSSDFLETVNNILLQSEQCILASIVYHDEEWSRLFKELDFIWLIEVTTNNRDFLPEILVEIFLRQSLYFSLPDNTQEFIKKLFFYLIDKEMFVAAKKLFKNAIRYVVEDKVVVGSCPDAGGSTIYNVEGDTSLHEVRNSHTFLDLETSGLNSETGVIIEDKISNFSCDCPLYNGIKPFSGRSQICSHIIAILIHDSMSNDISS